MDHGPTQPAQRYPECMKHLQAMHRLAGSLCIATLTEEQLTEWIAARKLLRQWTSESSPSR